jgi:transcriptional regulator with GAF, ATPase, and Fis domain
MARETINRTTLVDDQVRSLAATGGASAATLVCVFSPKVGLTFEPYPLDTRPLTIGRNPKADPEIAIEDQKASRRHAQIRWVEEAQVHALCDARSTNGSYLNGVAVDRERLRQGDVVRTGNSLFVYSRAMDVNASDDALFVGRSRVIQEAIDSLRQVAPTDLKVLVTGETGTGKELAAQTLHASSGRRGPFVPVNCGSFPASLIESELFGYTKGAFSGADRAKEGLIASADGGTLFLDEIGEFPIDLQPRLLRVLQDQEVRPVGATSARRVDVRFVAATNRDVIEMVERDAFRRDLLARLNEWPIVLPPLRERREDIGLLVRHFLRQRDAGAFAQLFDPDLLEYMLLGRWEGNVRELAAAVARLAVTFKAGRRDLDSTLRQVFAVPPPRLPLERRIPEPPGEEELRAVMALFEGNISGVSRYYGKERQQVYRWMERFGISGT